VQPRSGRVKLKQAPGNPRQAWLVKGTGQGQVHLAEGAPPNGALQLNVLPPHLPLLHFSQH
jgi:hypothetical protein